MYLLKSNSHKDRQINIYVVHKLCEKKDSLQKNVFARICAVSHYLFLFFIITLSRTKQHHNFFSNSTQFSFFSLYVSYNLLITSYSNQKHKSVSRKIKIKINNNYHKNNLFFCFYHLDLPFLLSVLN